MRELLWELLISDGDHKRSSRRCILSHEFSWLGIGISAHPSVQAVLTLMAAERIEDSDNFAVRPHAMLRSPEDSSPL